MYLLSIFPSELNCFLVWSEYIWFSLLCFCPSFVSWVLPRLKFPNIHPSALLKAKVFLTSLQPTPVPTVCLMASRAQGTPCWMRVAYLMASEAQLEPTQKWAIEEEVWAPPSHLNHSRKAAFRSPAERGKLSCIFAWGRRMTPQMMPVTGRSQNFPVVKSGGHQSNSVTKFCITSHYVPLDMVRSEVQIFICEVSLPKCLIYVSWSLLYLSFSLQEVQGIIRNTLSGTMRKQSYKSRSLDIAQNNWSRLLNRPKSCEERGEEGVCFILKETWNP